MAIPVFEITPMPDRLRAILADIEIPGVSAEFRIEYGFTMFLTLGKSGYYFTSALPSVEDFSEDVVVRVIFETYRGLMNYVASQEFRYKGERFG